MRQLTEKRLISLIAKAQDARDTALWENDLEVYERYNGVIFALLWVRNEDFSTEAWLGVSE